MVWDLPAEEEELVLETGACPITSTAESASKLMMPKEMTNFFMSVVFIRLNNALKDNSA